MITLTSAQALTKSINGFKIDNRSPYSESEILFLLNNNTSAADAFKKYKKHRKISKVLGYSSIVSMSAGSILVYAGTRDTDTDPEPVKTMGGIILFTTGGVIAGSVGLIQMSHTLRAKSDVIYFYNQDSQESIIKENGKQCL